MTVEELFAQIPTLSEIKTAKAGTIVRDGFWNIFFALIDTTEPPKQADDYKQPVPEQDQYYLFLTWQQFNLIKEDMAKKTPKPGKGNSDKAPGNSGNAPGHNKDTETGKPTKPVTPTPVPTPEIEAPATPPVVVTPPVIVPDINIPEIEEPTDVLVPVGEPVTDDPEETKPEPLPQIPDTTTPPEETAPEIDAPIFTPLPEEPAVPQVEAPVLEQEERPLPPPIFIPDPKPSPPSTGKRKTGDFTHHIRYFTNDSGGQLFDWLNDNNLVNTGWIANDNHRAMMPDNWTGFWIPDYINADTEKLILQQSNKERNGIGVKYHAYLKNKTFVQDIFGAGYQYMGRKDSKTAPIAEHLPVLFKNIAVIMQEKPKTEGTGKYAHLPAEIDFWGEFDDITPEKYPRPQVEFQNQLGACMYPYSVGNADAGQKVNPDMLKVITDSLGVVRNYSDSGNMLHEGKVCISPTKTGGWKQDDYTKAMLDAGVKVLFNPKENEGSPAYVDVCRQIAIRWGNNQNVPDNLVNIYTSSSYPSNVIKKGLGYNITLIMGGEINRWWKGRADIPNQKNLVGFMTPYEAVAQYILCYNAVKEVDPTIEVLTGGLALTNPGYFIAMAFYCEFINKIPIYGGNKVPWDGICYNAYNNEKGGQREGATRGLPPELTNYRKNAERLCQTEYELQGKPGRAPIVFVLEHGYSIADAEKNGQTINGKVWNVNPEQTAYAIGEFDRFEVQGMWMFRTALSSDRAGLSSNTGYQLYDDKQHVWNPENYMNWDLANGMADRNTNNIHKKRTCTEYYTQAKKLLHGYVMAEPGDETAEVVIDKFQKAGQPDRYTLGLPTITGAKKDVPFNIPEAKSYTVHYFVKGQEEAVSEIIPATGKNVLKVSEKTCIVTVNK